MTQHQSPAIAGREADLHYLLQNREPVWIEHTNLKLEGISSAFACALHMHQPTIPAGKSGELVSHLQYMVENQERVTITTRNPSLSAIDGWLISFRN